MEIDYKKCEGYGGITGVLQIFCRKECRIKYESECKKCFQDKGKEV